MRKVIYIIILCHFALLLGLHAQEKSPLYFENAPRNMMRFYFDQNYFLVSKDCEFKYIERVSAFNKETNKFDGIFKDFDPNGRMILSGHYQNGKKQGEFKAYHPNGELKWESNFVDGEASGSWKYYYPDGKPMLFITINQNDFYINQYWNRKGQQLVKDGEGSYDIDLAINGFTEHGYTRFNRQGKVKNGKPEGLWYIFFLDDRKKNEKIHVMTEQYENGELRGKEVSSNFEGVLVPEDAFIFTPNDYFPRAELLWSKACSFDEFTGFNIFIANKFLYFLKTMGYQGREDFEQTMTYTVNVSKKGAPSAVTLLPLPGSFSKNEKALFNKMVQQIHYYLPSYLSSRAIDDQLTITFIIKSKGETIQVFPAQIQRQKGM